MGDLGLCSAVSMGNSKQHVWLVHGTWAHGILRSMLWHWLPKWRPTRVAWPQMRGALEAAGCVVHDFIWSGRNSHAERLAAGDRLALEIETVRRECGDGPSPARVFLVSHSHGGNVALYAGARLSPPPEGIVCLATPFLHVEPLNLDTGAFEQLRGALSIIAFLVAFTIWSITTYNRLPIRDTITVFLGLAVAVLVGWVVSRLVLAAKSRFERAAGQAAAEAQQLEPAPPAGPVLLLRKAGDEASAILLTGQLGEWLTTKIWKLLSTLRSLPDRLIELLVRRHPRIAVSLFFIAGGGIFTTSKIRNDTDLPWRILGWAILGVVLATVTVAALQALLGIALIVLSYLRLGRGSQALLAPLLLKITTEAVPAGAHSLRVTKGSGTGALAHSEIHHDERVIAQIVGWIAGGAAPPP